MMKVKMWLMSCLSVLTLSGFGQKTPKNIPVEVVVNIVAHSNDKNLILYNTDRQLNIPDFAGRPDGSSQGVAATYSGIQMEMKGLVKDNRMQLTVSLMVYFDKSKSWAKKEGKNERVLAHEQNHFDLTAIKACELAQSISNTDYKSEKAMEQIREQQRKYTRELNELQVQYDRETKHGVLNEQQAAWAKRIAENLNAVNCF